MHDFAGWSDLPNGRLAVLPDTRHTEVMQRTEELCALVRPFLA